MTRTQPPPGFTLPRVLSSTLVDRDAPDLELEVINKLLPLLADKSHTVFDLCDVSGLNFDELATLLESERVDKAYRAMCRILAIRQKFIDAQSHFVTTAQLLSIASAQPMDAKEADQSRKAANKLHSLITHGAEGVPPSAQTSRRRKPATQSPSPAPAGEVSASSPTEGVRPPLPSGGPTGKGRGEGSSPSGPPSSHSSPHAQDAVAGLRSPTKVTQLHAACGTCKGCNAAP
jgi:hypothetical protein